MKTRLRTGSCFYSTCLSPELHPILPDLINSNPGSSVNVQLVDIFTKSCIISLTFLTQRHTEFYFFFLREVGTKERLWHFVITRQYAATKPDSFSNIQIRKISFQKYNTLAVRSNKVSQGTQIILWLSCFHFHVTRLLISAVIFVKLDRRICTRRTSALATNRPCLRQVNLALAQSDEQLHLIICRSDSGAAGRSVIQGGTWSFITFHP